MRQQVRLQSIRFPRTIVYAGIALMCSGIIAPIAAAGPPRRAERLVILVWDGLRPDTVNEQDTPALMPPGQAGTTFANHHCVYLSSTEVNGTALATGDYPQHTGIVANDEYRPEIRPLEPIAMQSDEAVRDRIKAAHGAYIAAPTMAEILRRTGRWTVVAGSKPVALLLDRHERGDGAGVSACSTKGRHGRRVSIRC